MLGILGIYLYSPPRSRKSISAMGDLMLGTLIVAAIFNPLDICVSEKQETRHQQLFNKYGSLLGCAGAISGLMCILLFATTHENDKTAEHESFAFLVSYGVAGTATFATSVAHPVRAIMDCIQRNQGGDPDGYLTLTGMGNSEKNPQDCAEL